MAEPPRLNRLPADQPVTLSLLIGAVVENYGTFYEMRSDYLRLQDWVRAQKKIDESHR